MERTKSKQTTAEVSARNRDCHNVWRYRACLRPGARTGNKKAPLRRAKRGLFYKTSSARTLDRNWLVIVVVIVENEERANNRCNAEKRGKEPAGTSGFGDRLDYRRSSRSGRRCRRRSRRCIAHRQYAALQAALTGDGSLGSGRRHCRRRSCGNQCDGAKSGRCEFRKMLHV